MYIPVTQATDKQIVDYIINSRICPSLRDDFIDEGEEYDEEEDCVVPIPPYRDYKLKRTPEKGLGENDFIRLDVTLFDVNYFECIGNEEFDNYIVDCLDYTVRLHKTELIEIYDNEKSEHPLF